MSSKSNIFNVPHDIQSAASYVTNVLISNGFLDIDSSLELCTHQLHYLATNVPFSKTPSFLFNAHTTNKDNESDKENRQEGTPEIPKKIQQRAIRSDRSLLDLLNSLLSAINNDSKSREQMFGKIEELKKEVSTQAQRAKIMESQSSEIRKKSDEVLRINTNLESRVKELEKENRYTLEEFNKLQALLEKSRREFQVEIRKRDVEIGKLKKRVTEPLTRKLGGGKWSESISVGSRGDSDVDRRPLIIPNNKIQNITVKSTGPSGGFSRTLSSYSSIHKPPSSLVRSASPRSDLSDVDSDRSRSLSPKNDTSITALWQNSLVTALRSLANDNSLLHLLIVQIQLVLNKIAENGHRRTAHSLGASQQAVDMRTELDDFIPADQNSKETRTGSTLFLAHHKVEDCKIPVSETLSYYSTHKSLSLGGLDNLQAMGYDIEGLTNVDNFLHMLNPRKSGNINSISSSNIYHQSSNVLPLLDPILQTYQTRSHSHRSGTEIARVIQPIPIKAIQDNLELALSKVSRVVHDSSLVPFSEVDKRNKEIQHLQSELKKKTELWESALETMEKWKTYREERSHMVD